MSFHKVIATPGPGSYVMPSEFGIYESRNKEMFLEKEEKGWKTHTDKFASTAASKK